MAPLNATCLWEAPRVEPWPSLRATDGEAALTESPNAGVRRVRAFSLTRLVHSVKVLEMQATQLSAFESPVNDEQRAAWHESLAFLQAIPTPVRASVSTYRYGHLPLLRLAAAGPWAARMLEDSPAGHPALAYALARFVERKAAHGASLSTTEVLRLVGLPRTELAGMLGWPATEQAVRVLRRIPPASLSDRTLRKAVRLAADPARCRPLVQDVRLNGILIDVLSNPALAPKITPHFAWELGGESDRYRALLGRMLMNLLNDEAGGDPGDYALVPAFASFAQLDARSRRVRAEAADDLERFAVFPLPPIDFAQLPIRTDITLVPIRDYAALHREGCRMHHCVARFGGEIAKGQNCYAYQMLAPVRATVLLKRYFNRWRLSEARQVLNRPVAGELCLRLSMLVRWAQAPLHEMQEAFDRGSVVI